jgi:biopolymer transport protein ExbB/TolQ
LNWILQTPGTGNLTAVTGGVAEALIATVVGLIIAWLLDYFALIFRVLFLRILRGFSQTPYALQ